MRIFLLTSTIVAYINGMLKEIKERKEKRAFIRVFDGKMWYDIILDRYL